MALLWLFANPLLWLTAAAIFFFTVLAASLHNVVRTWQRSKLLEKVFSGPSRHWLYGSLKYLARTDENLRLAGEEFTVKYPFAYVMWLGPFEAFLTATHPDSVKKVAGSEPRSPFYRRMKCFAREGIFLQSGAEWRRRRRLLTPAFHFDVLKPYVKIYNDRIQKTKEILLAQNSKPVEIFDVARKLTFEIILQCAFSYDCRIQGDSSPDDEYMKAADEASSQITYRVERPYLHNDFLYSWTSSSRKSTTACNTLHQKANEIIASRRKEKHEKDVTIKKRKYLDFIDILLEAKDESGNGMTDSEIQDEVATFMFAGHDTTSAALSWTLYLLASHQDELKKCQEEVDAAIGDKEDVEWDDLAKFAYLTMCIKESLRHRPSAPFISRTFTKETEIAPGKVIPAFTTVSANIYALHHHPDVWDQPEQFDPSRFTVENSKNRSPYAYVPFSAGARNCIGQHLAMHELKVVVAHIIRSFNVSVVEDHPVSMHCTVILKSKHGIKLVFKPRRL